MKSDMKGLLRLVAVGYFCLCVCFGLLSQEGCCDIDWNM